MAADSQDHTVVVHVTPGELLDERWRIESRIGQGAMGSVFRGRDLKVNRVIAVKLLAPEHCRKPKVLARFEREAETMTTLRHPNIVQLYGHGRRGALPFIVMEFLEGLTLSDVLQRRDGKLSLAETLAVVKQVAAGLSFLHHHGLVHRDVKPQNIVIGAEGRVTILDLGVVRDQANPGLTRPGAMVGTPYYMSPEQIYGVDDIDRRTDVYALAAMTFELLTGRPPFLGNNNFEVLYGHKNVAPPDASALVKSVTKPVSQVLIRGMAKQRNERPDTVSEFVADLEAATAGIKKIDLSKAFAFVKSKASAKPSAVVSEATRMVPRHQPRIEASEAAASGPEDSGSDPELLPDSELEGLGSAEIPMADPDDIDSVSEERLPSGADSSEGKTVVLKVDETFIGRSPKRDQDKTHYITMPDLKPVPADDLDDESDAGELQVVVSFKGRAVRASVSVDGAIRASSPCTIPLAPGDHAVRVELVGYQVVNRTADVAPAQKTTLRVALERL